MSDIRYIDRASGQELIESVPAEKIMNWLYNKPFGKLALHALLKRKIVSTIGGWYMNSRWSKKRIQSFIESYNIRMSDYEITDSNAFSHFNDFFYRKINKLQRPIEKGVVSPADGKTLAFQEISDHTSFFIKGSEFSLNRFLNNDELAKQFDGGSMLIIRLAPTDYHRFHFPYNGTAAETTLINGHYFSVSPIALQQSLEVFCQNKRTRSILKTKEYGNILISEVGATMVGSILQTYQPDSEIKKGDEKGYFAFGGSTVVLLFEKGKVQLSQDLIDNSKKGFETQVKMGETIGL